MGKSILRSRLLAASGLDDVFDGRVLKTASNAGVAYGNGQLAIVQSDIPLILLLDGRGELCDEGGRKNRYGDGIGAMNLLAAPLLLQAGEIFVGKHGHLFCLFVGSVESRCSRGADVHPEAELAAIIVAPQSRLIGVVEAAPKFQAIIAGQGAGQNAHHDPICIFRRVLGDTKLQRFVDVVVDIGELQMEAAHRG